MLRASAANVGLNNMSNNSYKISKFNNIREINGKKIIYNFRTGGLVELTENSFKLIKKASLGPIDLNDEEKEQNEFLLDAFFVPAWLDEIKYLEIIYENAKKNASELSLTILPTLSCNFNCYYCYQNKKNENLRIDVVSGILKLVSEQADTVDQINISWYGGEPLLLSNQIYTLSKELKRITDKHRISYNAGLISNCYLLTPHIADKLFEAGLKRLQVTYDGPREYHDKIRNVHGKPSFDLITKNIKYALNQWEITIRVNVSHDNYYLIPILLEQLAESGLNKASAINFAPVHFGRTINSKLISSSDFEEYCVEFSEMAFNLGFNISFPLAPHFKPCSAVTLGAFVIEPNGSVKKCWNDVGNYTRNIGFLSSNGLKLIPNKELDNWINHNPFMNQDCRDCLVLPCCLGGCPWVALNNSPSESLCHKSKSKYGAYIDMVYNWLCNGAEYDPIKQTIKPKK